MSKFCDKVQVQDQPKERITTMERFLEKCVAIGDTHNHKERFWERWTAIRDFEKGDHVIEGLNIRLLETHMHGRKKKIYYEA